MTLQLGRLIAIPVIQAVLAGADSPVWIYPAVLDVVVAATTPFLLVAIWRIPGPATWLATRDIDLLYDTRKHLPFVSAMKRLDTSMIGVLRKADKTFHVRPARLQTAVNDDGFEVDIIRRMARDGAPHPLRMTADADDLWALQVPSGNRLVSGRRFEQMVVGQNGAMALMRTVHPLDFIQVKNALANAPARDPLKRRKDRLQADVVAHLWAEHLQHMQRHEQDGTSSQAAPQA